MNLKNMNLKRKFCPRCGSSNIKWVIPQLWSIWRCGDCGYYGSVIVEDGKLADEIKKKYMKDKEERR